MKIVIDIPKESYDFAKECKHNGTSKYNWCLSHNDVVFMVANGTPISDNATNGDMMKHIFSNVPVKIFEDMNTVIFGNTQFDLEWWNAPYTEKRGGENE